MIIGHQKQKEFLNRMVSSGRLPHALLFSGQEKLGKKTIALEFIASIFKESPERLLAGHPDFIFIEPQEKQIQINQIRELSWKLSLKPILSPLIAAIVDRAHLMTREAQNCFLKTLEEPKTNSLLILITEYPSFLYSTILSRCQMIKFYPVKKDEIENFLQKSGIPQDKIKEIADIARGRPGVARELILFPEKLEEIRQTFKKLNKISISELASRFQYAKELSEKENLGEVLDIWLGFFRNVLLTKLNKINQTSSWVKLGNILRQIQKTNYLITTTNVNHRLALELLMMEF